jgi:hypothetical protein
MKEWTKRGVVTSQDQEVIGAIVRREQKAGRILITGEIDRERLGEPCANLLFASNDMTGEPLFTPTNAGTVRMTRFDAEAVWPAIDKALLDKLIGSEAQWVSMPELVVDDWDFCRSIVRYAHLQYGEFAAPKPTAKDLGAFYQTIYLSALFLLDKPGYMTVPVAQHFALPETAAYLKSQQGIKRFRTLEPEEVDELMLLREEYGKFDGLVNKELNFLVNLYEKGLKE